jgi:homoserine O-acetyltransferase
MEFPAYNMRDMINAEYKLIRDTLGIDHLLAVTGLSMGAMKTLQFAVSYPEFMDGIILTVGGAVWSTQTMYCHKILQTIIENCAGWDDGNYTVNPVDGAASALWSWIPMMYSREWWNENITSFEAFKGWWNLLDQTYTHIQDARDLYLLSKAMQRSNIADTPAFNGDLMAALKSVKAKTLFITSPYDQWYLPEQIELQHKAISDSRLVSINATVGHFICCGVDPQATWTMGEAIRGFLREVKQGTK